MSQDQELSRLRRKWELESTDRNADIFLNLARRLNAEAPKAMLRQSTRWKPLINFVETWFDHKLCDDDGCSWQEILDVEKGIGREFPEAMREWFLLINNRLGFYQDGPVLLQEQEEIHRDGTMKLFSHLEDCFVLYRENQRCVDWYTYDSNSPDPPVCLSGDYYEAESGVGRDEYNILVSKRLSEFVLLKFQEEMLELILLKKSMTEIHEDFFPGIQLCAPLRETVRGGQAEGEELISAIAQNYQLYFSGPYWPGLCDIYIDDSTFVICKDDYVLLMTLTLEAWDRVDRIVREHSEGWIEKSFIVE